MADMTDAKRTRMIEEFGRALGYPVAERRPMREPFTVQELDLIIEALERAASRHESEARYNPRGRNRPEHDRTAIVMRRLRARLMKLKQPETA
jgi:hypothetical protein